MTATTEKLKQAVRLSVQIDRLTGRLKVITEGLGNGHTNGISKRGGAPRRMSPEALQRIKDAQHKRWAKWRKAKR